MSAFIAATAAFLFMSVVVFLLVFPVSKRSRIAAVRADALRVAAVSLIVAVLSGGLFVGELVYLAVRA